MPPTVNMNGKWIAGNFQDHHDFYPPRETTGQNNSEFIGSSLTP
jgi:hypothetical protein